MRLRNIKGAREAIGKSPFVELAPEEYRGRWRDRFGNGHPVWLEVGMGKGQFIMELARRYPEVNFIGVEMYSSVLIRAVQKREREEMENLLFLRIDARTLPECFAPGEVERIFLNFSDPWPKDRHAKRRLTSRQFLERYTKILERDGLVEFKTDNRDLYMFSLEEREAAGWRLLYSTEDLHGDGEAMRDNVMTEYEERFSAEGKPIYKMVIRQP
ncbi:MAG TPA: tRNA (guanosine(46)-N7)-methyltransferase TrmB [Lachnospiraceae bacterium]|nr:tRNA (guanosine(46)-N7)-methyltransferase TrmB [Lachnospiraceae bacterium]